MSSDLFLFDGPFYHHSSSDSDIHFFSDPLSPFQDPPADNILQAISNLPNHQNPYHESHFLDQFALTLPPSYQMENMSLYQQQSLSNYPNFETGSDLYSGLETIEVKNEDSHMSFSPKYEQPFVSHSYSGGENVAKLMQRSYSSNSFDKPGFRFQPRFNSLMESPDLHNQATSLPENSILRRVCSTGDLQNMRAGQMAQGSFLTSPLAAENCFTEEENLKVGRYSAEERKERIQKYRAKRAQRNFNKTIKYACRKTLADSRPRIRGRFARNDEPGESPIATSSIRDQEEEFLLDGLFEVRGGRYMDAYGQSQFSIMDSDYLMSYNFFDCTFQYHK